MQGQKNWDNSVGKNPDNCETIRNETNIYEQKPINVDDFNDIEESEVKERVQARKEKRIEVAQKSKLFLKKEETRRIKGK